MSLFKSLGKKSGFSMIELMVVVAIIGVLASIGIPRYQKFQAKARQSEAKLALAALFTAEESFRQEWNQFSVDLKNIGFGVQGARLRYFTGFVAGSACTSYSTGFGAPAESTTSANTWSNGTNVNTGGASWAYTLASYPASGSSCSSSTFTAMAYGNPAATASDPGNTNGDTWTVNQVKLIANTLVNLGS